ncbi:substrate-binding domain-containing protein [Pseudarthrobacter oxydans]|uniref:substrate-binding domain-containing protein n=1 Tax=Pseudarthrobacter oxydans TaxID=1671 RepID=UPI003F4FCD1E
MTFTKNWSSPSIRVPGGYEAALRLLKQKDRPTAVFCYNDRMAMGLPAAGELGLSIPDDISFVGFDNQQLIAENPPALTTSPCPTTKWAHGQPKPDRRHRGKTDRSCSPLTRLSCPVPWFYASPSPPPNTRALRPEHRIHPRANT